MIQTKFGRPTFGWQTKFSGTAERSTSLSAMKRDKTNKTYQNKIVLQAKIIIRQNKCFLYFIRHLK